MPNTGKPSKDCHTCRKRRVKCTLERPECQRCLRIGKKCPGYRDEQSLLFRNEDISSLGNSTSSNKDRRRARSDNSSDVDESTGTISRLTSPDKSVPFDWSFRGIRLKELDAIVRNDGSLPLCPIPLDKWSHYAVPVVLTMISYETEGRRIFSQFQILADLLNKSPNDSPLIMCCEALGIAYLANRFVSAEAETIRDQAYGQALAATTTLVGDPGLCQQDEASICVWLLSVYEVVTGPQRSTAGSSTITWNIHAQGQVELLRLRGPAQLQTRAGQNVFWLLALSTQMRTLITCEEYPPFIQEWLVVLRDRITGPAKAFIGLSSFAHDLSAIGTAVREALSTDDNNFLLWTVTKLWDKLLSSHAILDDSLAELPLGEPINLMNLYISSMYRTYYIRTLQHMLDLAESSQAREDSGIPSEYLDGIVSSIRDIVQDMTAAILSTVPAVLTAGPEVYSLRDNPICHRPACWPDVLKLLWPLRILSARRQLLTDEQAEFSELILQHISEDFGIRQAVAIYHMLDRPFSGS